MNLEQLKDKKVAILGVGMEGIALADFLSDFTKTITLLDKLSEGELEDRAQENKDEKLQNILKDKRFAHQFGQEYLEKLNDFEIVFRSPGIPYLHSKIQEAKKAKVLVSSQIKLFFDLCPCPIIGVTGTKGKGTTATLIFEMLKKSQTSNLKPQTCNLKSQNLTESHCEESGSLDLSGQAPQSDPNRLPRPEGLAMTGSNEAIKPLNFARGGKYNNVYLAGNIGEPSITLIDKLQKNDLVILELSSFQLQDLDKSPHIAVVTNISIDHLDYHKSEVEYKESKVNIVKYQNKNDFSIINQDYLTSFEFASQTNAKVYYFSGKDSVNEGSYIRKCQMSNVPTTQRLRGAGKCQKYGDHELLEVVLKIDDKEEIICRSDEVKLIGRHNLENIAAASVAAYLLGADIQSISNVVKNFAGLPHRLEFVKEINGVKFYNDSYATNPDPTIAAINSFKKPIHLILGGSSKGADFSKLARTITASNVKTAILIGDEKDRVKDSLKKSGYTGKVALSDGNFDKVVKEIVSLSKPGDIALLSPACASFGLFKNYKQRGEKFKKSVVRYDKV